MRAWAVLVGMLALSSAVAIGCGSSEDRRGLDAGWMPPPPPPPQSCLTMFSVCRSDDDCCTGVCSNTSGCLCVGEGGSCESAASCCAGLDCRGGRCTLGCRALGDPCIDPEDGSCCSGACQNGVCAQVQCGGPESLCYDSTDCCAGHACDTVVLEGTCRSGCGLEGVACDEDGDCCVGFDCTGGLEDRTCERVCIPEGEACTGEGVRCCEGNRCVDGSCQPCVPSSYGCNEDANCCGDRLSCIGGKCSCGLLDAPCDADADCCPELHCHDGQCRSSGLGQRCTFHDQCIGTDVLCESGVCVAEVCRDNGRSCGRAADCCEGGCHQGSCCTGDGETCEESLQCCGESRCLDVTGACGPCRDKGASCGTGYDCCSGNCFAGTCCAELNDACSATEPCCGELECDIDGTCCGPLLHDCEVDGDCCSGRGLICPDSDGRCCKQPREPCTDSVECCFYMNCNSGICCEESGEACISNEECCTGKCEGGVCACGQLGDSCGWDFDCCDSFTMACAGDPPRCCLEGGNDCTSNDQCCSGVCGSNGRCTS